MRNFSRITPIALLLLGLPRVALAGQMLPVPVRFQERNGWCWNACTQMVAFYYTRYYATQCEIAENPRIRDGGSWGTTNCCLNPDVGCNHWGGFGSEVNSLGIGTFGQDGALSFEGVRTEINAGHPISANSNTHAHVVRGYSNFPTTALHIVDPNPNGVGAYTIDYATYVSTFWLWTVKTTGRTTDQATIYANQNFGGTSYAVTSNVGQLYPSIDNQTSSMKAVGFPFVMYDGPVYSGTAWGISPRDYSTYTKWYGTDNTISSAKLVPGSASAQPTMVVLFENTDFKGASQIITSNNNDLPGIGWNDRVSSLVVLGGLAQVFQHTYGGGLAYAVTSDGGPHYDGFYPNPSSWGGPDNDMSSVHLYLDDLSPTSTTSPIVLYQGTNFTGRALLIRWVAANYGDDPIGWANYLGNQGMDDNVNSIRTYAGKWRVYADPNQSGPSASLDALRWYKNSAEIGLTLISSLAFTSAGWMPM